MHPAGIFSDIAADRAGDLRRRIGRVVEAGMRHGLADREVGDAGFGHHHAVVEIDLADALELAQAQQHAVGQRQCAARQRGTGAAWHHLDALLAAVFQDFRDLLRGVRQHHDHRWLPVRHQAIGLVGQHLGRAVDHALTRHDRAQRRDDGVTAIQDRLIGSRHHDGHAYPPGPRITICDGKSSTSAKVWVGHPKVGLPRLERSVLSGTSLQ